MSAMSERLAGLPDGQEVSDVNQVESFTAVTAREAIALRPEPVHERNDAAADSEKCFVAMATMAVDCCLRRMIVTAG